MQEREIYKLLQAVKSGQTSIDQAIDALKKLPFEDLGYAMIDHHREIRNGYPEVIFAQGKTIEQIKGIVNKMLIRKNNILATRAGPDVYQAVKEMAKQAEYYEQAKIVYVPQNEGELSRHIILVASAGTSDIPVAEEAAVTAEKLGNRVQRLYDVGVAGIHRLLTNLDVLNEASVIIAVAGMEGALASVIGGLVDKPVIAVPTSVGYGASLGGVAALLAMLNSCASGVGVVNIDNGFGAAYLASTINRQLERAIKK